MSMVKHRPSAAWRRRRSASSGMNRPIASSTSRSSWAGRTLCATWATWQVDVRGGLHRQEHGLAGDPAGPPRGQVALDDPGPDPAEPVAELDGLAEVGLAGLGGQPDRGGELGDRELRDQGGPGSGDRHPGLAVVPHGGRLVEGVHRVHRRPGDRRLQLPGLRRRRPGGPRAPRNSSTAAAVSRSAVLPVMTQFQHRPPTLRPRKRGSPQGSGKLFSRTFSSPVRAEARPPARRWPTGSTTEGGVVSTGSTTEGSRAWSRQARPPGRGVVSTGSTTEGCGVVSTGSTTERPAGPDRLDHTTTSTPGPDAQGISWRLACIGAQGVPIGNDHRPRARPTGRRRPDRRPCAAPGRGFAGRR